MDEINDFLKENISKVRSPLRYLDREFNSHNKKFFNNIKNGLNAALVFPDVYELGMSHQGLHILYNILNNKDYICCDRAFFPYPDLYSLMEKESIPMFSLENRKSLKKFDLLGFTVQYELAYTTILKMIYKSNIEIESKDRKNDDPIVIAGGPIMSNPEPIAPFMDVIFIGEAEEGLIEIADIIKQGKIDKVDRNQILKDIAKNVKGAYVPQFYDYIYNEKDEFKGFKKKIKDIPDNIDRRILDFKNYNYDYKRIVPNIDIVHNRASLEIMRGCPNGCRFCHAGYFYRPKREKDETEINKKARKMLESTGYDTLSLLSLSSMDYSEKENLLNKLAEFTDKNIISLEVPSSRVDKVDEKTLKRLTEVSNSNITIAPEAGTQRLRNVINKNITENEIMKSIELIRKLNFKSVKLYFMIGLPTETRKDHDGIIELVNKIKDKINRVRVSLSVFTPKVHTPFQWEKQLSGKKLKETYSYIINNINRGIKISWRDEFTSFLEGIFSRGDRRLKNLLLDTVDHDIYLDGWDDYLNISKWKDLLNKHDITRDYLNSINIDKKLPWNIINIGIDKDFFIRERKKAYNEKITSKCNSNCRVCGVCDEEINIQESSKSKCVEKEDYQKFNYEKRFKHLVYYKRVGHMRYLSQRDMINVIHFSLYRSNLPIMFTQGYNPHPKVSFFNPTPLGVAVEDDFFVMRTYKPIDIKSDEFSDFFPKNFKINRIKHVDRNYSTKPFKYERVSFKYDSKAWKLLNKKDKNYYNSKKNKNIEIKGIKNLEKNENRICFKYKNTETSIKHIMYYIYGNGFREYDKIDCRREKLLKG